MCQSRVIVLMKYWTKVEVGFQNTKSVFYFADNVVKCLHHCFIRLGEGGAKEVNAAVQVGIGGWFYGPFERCYNIGFAGLDINLVKPVNGWVFLFETTDAFIYFF